MRIAWLTVAIVIVGAAPAGARPQLDAKQGLTDSACQALQSLPLANGHVDSATPVQAMPFTMEIQPGSTLSLDQPPHCRMMATLTPTRESDIRIEVWLPEREWNGKLLGIGNVNWCGGVNALQMAVGLREHYVVVGTNRGHTGCSADSTFIARPAKLQEFGYLAVHEMTKIAKGTILAYYGKKPAHSYFLGGSSGGGQALMEAQRYPDDYDGIVASAPTIEWTHLMAANLWNAQVASVLSRDSLTALHDAVIAECDSVDQIGLLDDPRNCHFDPETLLCTVADAPARCLTRTQVDAARKLYDGPDTAAGKKVHPGMARGTELGWPLRAPNGLFVDYFRFLIHEDERWDWHTFDLNRDVALADERHQHLLNPVDADLRPFAKRNGKLILIQGWSDATVLPQYTVQYYERVSATLGKRVQDSVRLFMVPRMGHGRGGTDQFNPLAALERWVEEGVAPDRILAQQVSATPAVGPAILVERPLCPYPKVARWKGRGSRNDAANFECASR